MKAIFTAIAILLSSSAHADFAADLAAKYPQTAGSIVKKSFGDFYSVTRGQEVLYINEAMTVMINGDVVDLVANKNLTALLKEANKPKVNLADFKLEDAIKFGSGPKKVFAFSDPECGYCKQIQREFSKLKDITVYVYPYPSVGGQRAAAVSESVWCSKDRSSSWTAYVERGVAPATATCANPVERNIALANKLQIRGTPALVFEDGSIVPGAVPASVIQNKTAAIAGK